MRSFQVFQVDAFTNTLFKGNPAAVVPLQTWLSEADMQQIAMENNLPETAFFVPSTVDGADFHLRWFTPVSEIDLCGHATVATAFVLKQLLGYTKGDIIFSTQVSGLLQVVCHADGQYALIFPAYQLEPAQIPEGAAAALGLPEEEMVEAWLGRDLMLVLRSAAAVAAAKPDSKTIVHWPGKGCLITAAGAAPYDVSSRCFFPKEQIDEDPVTGSAHCHIVPYWLSKLPKTELLCYQASARSGVLRCSMQDQKVVMAGTAVHYLTGTFYLPDMP